MVIETGTLAPHAPMYEVLDECTWDHKGHPIKNGCETIVYPKPKPTEEPASLAIKVTGTSFRLHCPCRRRRRSSLSTLCDLSRQANFLSASSLCALTCS